MASNSLDTALLVSWVLIHSIQGIPCDIFYCEVSSQHHCKDTECLVKGVEWLVLQILCGGQFRFSLYSGAVTRRCWLQFISYLLVCLLFLCRSPLVLKLFCCVSLSAVLGFCSLFYTVHILQCMQE